MPLKGEVFAFVKNVSSCPVNDFEWCLEFILQFCIVNLSLKKWRTYCTFFQNGVCIGATTNTPIHLY